MFPLVRRGSFTFTNIVICAPDSKSDGTFSIDLHGLTLEEAKRVATDRTQLWHASQNYGQSGLIEISSDERYQWICVCDSFIWPSQLLCLPNPSKSLLDRVNTRSTAWEFSAQVLQTSLNELVGLSIAVTVAEGI